MPLPGVSASGLSTSRVSLGASRALEGQASTAAYIATCLLCLVAPFERLQPLVSLPGQKITTVEAAVLVAALCWGAMLLVARRWPAWRSPIAWPWIAWLAVAAISTTLAEAYQLNAAKTVGRLALGWCLVLLPLNGVTSPSRLFGVVWWATAGGVVVAVVAALESAGAPVVLRWLEDFRQGVRVVGGQVRAGGTLQYPTIASMYFEIVFALALGAFLHALDRRRLAAASGLFVALAIVAAGITVTLTRSGLITMVVSLIAVGGARVWQRGWDRGARAVVALAAVVLIVVANAASAEAMRLRFTTEGQKGWYRAAFLTPSTLTLRPGSLHVIEVTVINSGRVTWDHDASPPFHISYHWFDDTMTRVVQYDGVRTKLTAPVLPGESVRVPVHVRAPAEPGSYRIGWDVVQEGRLWFSTEPGARLAVSRVTLAGDAPPASAPVEMGRPVPRQAVRLGRSDLWKAAVKMSVEHPVLGVGPDNYRLTYGPYAGLADPDTRITSNNTYLEVLTGTGLAGLGVFAWFGVALARATAARVRALASEHVAIYSGVVAAVLAIAVHGLVDSFLTLTPTLVVMSLTIGLAMAPAGWKDARASERAGAGEPREWRGVSGAPRMSVSGGSGDEVPRN